MPAEHADLPSSEQIAALRCWAMHAGHCRRLSVARWRLRRFASTLLAVLAIAYAIGWLVAASRTKAQTRFTGALYASTSALILAPMLWELTMRFQVLHPAASAAVLGLVVAVASALNWQRPMSSNFLVTYAAVALRPTLSPSPM
jgi:hypothetical protein